VNRIPILSAQAALLLMLGSCAPWNLPTRKVPAGGSATAGDSAYIESHRPVGPNYGCSFIEFDGKGGFLDYRQFDNALRVLQTRKAQSNVLLVIYCHGWNNNAQSGDVLHFVSFLRRLSDSSLIRAQKLRVEGVYLGWRGSQYLPVATRTEGIDPQLSTDFGGDLTDRKWNNSKAGDTIFSPARYLSYWSIKDRAEFHVSRVPLARAVFGLAFKLKSPTEERNGRHHRVFVIGHSFGALLLEQAIGQASVGLITSEWNEQQTLDARWPFDLIVFLNSAAPSLYAKQLGEFLQLDHKTSARPRIVSITSTGDWATGFFHPLGNWSKRFAPDLQREYHPFGSKGPVVPAWEYYDRTPGHNEYLLNHVVERTNGIAPPGLNTEDSLFSRNLRRDNPRNTFYTKISDGTIQPWIIRDLTDSAATSEAQQARKQYASNYWIATVPPEIIKDHNDIWSDSAMEMLAGIYGIVEQLSTVSPPQPQAHKMRAD
jgi:hypothetical protein